MLNNIDFKDVWVLDIETVPQLSSRSAGWNPAKLVKENDNSD